ncbi:MAG: ACP S-malonyltransferase [Caldilineaceae bacterium]|nr:ACP S-malonyltransferase [Caldilineaceae bacterium]
MAGFDFVAAGRGVAFLFPGQGSQAVGMGRELAAAYPVAAATFAEADEILGFGLSKLCFEGPEAELTDTINAQPALLATAVALLRTVAQELGQAPATGSDAPAYVAGHSMGEYSALVASGAVAYADALRLVRERGRLMKQAGAQNPGMMAAILGLDEAPVAAICAEVAAETGGVVQVANDNCPGQVVISGDKASMEAAMVALGSAGARKVVPLAVSIAAHSPLMQPAAVELRAAIDATEIADPRVSLIGNMTAQPLTTAAALRDELAAQLTGGVRWTASIQRAVADGVTNFVELGPGEALVGMVKRIDRTATRHSVGDPAGVAAFVAWWQAKGS